MSLRVGIGYDIHRLVSGRRLILGGVLIPYEKGLLGHSDGDVLVHAVIDAILGACALGDIGQRFPDTAEWTRDMNSLNMLQSIVEALPVGTRVVNIDANCICERPRLAPHRDEIVTTLAGALRVDPGVVSVKFRTHEGLGEIGRGEAIAAQAVVLMRRPDETAAGG